MNEEIKQLLCDCNVKYRCVSIQINAEQFEEKQLHRKSIQIVDLINFRSPYLLNYD